VVLTAVLTYRGSSLGPVELDKILVPSGSEVALEMWGKEEVNK
jgi:hypothetical protein